MNKKQKFALAIGILTGIYALAGFVLIPVVAKSIVPDKLSAALHRPVTIENIAFNPFVLSLTVEGLRIGEPRGTDIFVALGQLYVNLGLSSAVKLGPVIKEIRLTQPYVRVARHSDNTFNFSDLVANSDKDEATPAEPAVEKTPLRFALHRVQIIDGEVVFDDKTVDIIHRFSPLNFELPRISSFKGDIDIFSQPMLTGRVNDTDIAIAARTKPFLDSLETIVDIDVKGLRLPHYFGYAPQDIGFEVTNGGLDITSSVSFKRDADQKLLLEVSGRAILSGLELVDDAGNPFFSMAALDITMAPSAPLENNIHLKSIIIDAPHLHVVRGSDGTVNLATLGPGAAANIDNDNAETENDDEIAGPVADATETGILEAPEAEDASPPLVLAVDEIRLTAGRLDFRDLAAPAAGEAPMTMVLGDMTVSVDGFGLASGQSAAVEFNGTVNHTAAIGLTGSFSTTPLAGDMKLKITGLNPSWGQPYVPESIRLSVAGGSLDLTADAGVETTTDGELAASVAGNVSLTDFSVLDRDLGSDVLNIRLFSINGIDVRHNPTAIRIDDILLDGLSHQIVRQDDGALNLVRIFGAGTQKTTVKEESAEKAEGTVTPASPDEPAPDAGETDAPSASSALPFPVAIGEIRLQDLSVNFTDRHVTPNFSTRLDLTEGSVKGMTSESFEGADLMIKGAVDQQAVIAISGRINPLLADPLIDVTFELKNLELSPLSPYSGAYIGNAIEKGKLNLDLSYQIAEKQLQAKNQILLDQFTLGHKIDSPDALNLPVGLAIALLKDRSGEINLDIPVSGKTDDPRFSVGKIIIQSLTNIMTKAATSPFALAGILVGGGEELQYIEFVHGLSLLNEESIKKVKAVEELLFQRPELNLEITGYTDVEKDRTALAETSLDYELKTLKWSETGQNKDKDHITAAEQVAFTDEEYEKYLRKLYAKKVLSNPDAGPEAKPLSDKNLTKAEMRAAILGQITIPDAALGLLSRQRAQAVRKYILAQGRIDARRLFIIEAQTLSPKDKNADFDDARVELGLR
jgi:uncharacterized protein involved in outer membrane biogenesis